MSMKLGIATNKSIIELYNAMRTETLILKPFFQRNLVWNNAHKESFIETILMGLPFPEVYFADGPIDLEKQVSTTIVVDGQQRLNTIYEYITASPKLRITRLPKFAELDRSQQLEFFDYIVVVRQLGRLSDEKIREIFKRINSVHYALNAMEINNALYEGEFISTARSIANSDEFRNLGVLNEDDFARMKDLEFVLLIMTTIEIGGYFTQTKEVEEYIKLYDDNYPNKVTIYEQFIDALRTIQKLGKLDYDSMWYKKSGLFTLITELVKFSTQYGGMPIVEELEEVLDSLEDKIMENKNGNPDENPYAKFYKHVFQQTTSRVGRTARGNVLQSALEGLTPNKVQ